MICVIAENTRGINQLNKNYINTNNLYFETNLYINNNPFLGLRNSVLTAALMGSLICALLLVIAISCTCRLHALRMLETRLATTRETPLSRLSREFFFREPPPSYAVAVQGDPRRNLCVENLHYNNHHEAGVYRPRRGRRSRHSRNPVVVPINVPEPSTDESVVSSSEVVSSEETIKVEDSVTDSSECVKVEDVQSPGGEDVGLGLGAIAGGDQEEDSSIVSCDTRFYCDSDTDPLIV